MEVTLAVCCDAANVSREGKLNLLGIFNSIHAARFPAAHPHLALVLRVEARMGEEGTHPLEIKLVDEDGKQLFEVNGQLQLQGARPGRPMTAQTIIDMNNFQLPRAGTYSFEIFLAQKHARSVAIHVFDETPD
ncbi:MAG TPA: hypothetical protein VM778_06745 [Gemmatimonadota bacterium]|nr:hypothetical protein [Gemmatimonadota bacterium]